MAKWGKFSQFSYKLKFLSLSGHKIEHLQVESIYYLHHIKWYVGIKYDIFHSIWYSGLNVLNIIIIIYKCLTGLGM